MCVIIDGLIEKRRSVNKVGMKSTGLVRTDMQVTFACCMPRIWGFLK